MLMDRSEFLDHREKLLVAMDALVDGHIENTVVRDQLAEALADAICEIMDPAGLEEKF